MTRNLLPAVAFALFVAAAASPLRAQPSEFDARRAAAAKWSEAEVAEAVRYFLFDVLQGTAAPYEMVALWSVKDRVHPPLLKILADPTLRELLITPTSTQGLPEAPFNRAYSLLRLLETPTEFTPVLAPFLDVKSQAIRTDAAYLIGSIGSTESIPVLRRALADAESVVRQQALLGLHTAVVGQRLSAEARSELFDDLRQSLTGRPPVGLEARLMLKFDRERAVKVLVVPELLSADYAGLDYLLRELLSQKVEVPRSLLLPLVERPAGNLLKEISSRYALGTTLMLLGRHRNPADRARLEGYTSHMDDSIAWSAWNGLVAWHGLEGFEERIRRLEAEKGKQALSRGQRYFEPLTSLDADVALGGFSQYFSGANGDKWRETLVGLDALGFADHAALVREAVAKFGETPAAADAKQRMKRLIELKNAEQRPFGSIDDRYGKLKPSIMAAMLRYVVEHQDEFR